MKKELKDYLHLYLGCDVWLCKNIEHNDVVEKLTTRMLYEDAEMFESYEDDVKPYKLILRPLSDMTDGELKEVKHLMIEYENLSFRLDAHELMNKQYFYYENFDEDTGNLISTTISNIFNLPLKAIPYLLSKSFDLFGLIESGLAIDKTTVKEKYKSSFDEFDENIRQVT